jgi:hypothetical protein
MRDAPEDASVSVDGGGVPFRAGRVERSNCADSELTRMPTGPVVIEYWLRAAAQPFEVKPPVWGTDCHLPEA